MSGTAGPAGVTAETYRLDSEFVLPTYARQPLELVSGEGAYVFGVDGTRYLDFVTGLSVSNFGHCHPRVVAAVREQVGRLIHCSNLYYTAPQARVAERLSRLSNGGRVFFANSGAEANEAAIKAARKRAGLRGGGVVVTLERSFHGRTMATLTATGQPEKQAPFRPVLEGFVHVPPGDVEALAEVFAAQSVAAVMLEPVLGESGVHVLPVAFLQEAQRLCAAHDALLIVDEVQSGMGRCGAAFAYQRFGLAPDIVTVAKTLAGGLPMGAAIMGGRAEGVLGPGEHGSTFGAGPVVASAALAILDLLEEPGLFERVERLGARLQGWLERLRAGGAATDVRRLGLMAAVDVVGGCAKQVAGDALVAGILLNATSDDTVRFLPPLIVTDDEIDRVGSFLVDRLLSEPGTGGVEGPSW